MGRPAARRGVVRLLLRTVHRPVRGRLRSITLPGYPSVSGRSDAGRAFGTQPAVTPAGGGVTRYGSWCTNWSAYDVPRLWEMVAGEDSGEAWAQVSVWWRLSQALHEQRRRLGAVRDALVDAWPPEHSEASRRFVEILDGLTGSMSQAGYAAGSTAYGLAGILRALAEAKAQLGPLYEQWRARSADLVPGWLDGAEEELNEQARQVMARAELEVAEFTELLKPLPEFELDLRRSAHDPDQRAGQHISYAQPNPANVPPVPHSPPPPLPGVEPLLPDGPVLAGAPPSPVAPGRVDPGQAGVPVVAGGAGSGGGSWLVTTPRGRVLSPGGVIGPPATTPARGVPGSTAPPPAAAGAPARGGVATSGTGRAVPGLVTPGGMPPGGALGGQGRAGQSPRAPRSSPTLPVGGGFRTADGHRISVSGLNPRHGHPARRQPPDPNDPWAVDTGVPAVITPDPPRPHDPGPGVIGIDR